MNTDLIYFVIAGFFLMLIPVALIAGWFLRGFFMTFMKVKASQGKFLMVKVRSKLRDYYAKGFVIEGTMRFKDSKKNDRTIILPKDVAFIYRSLGVYWVDVDEDKNCVYTLDGRGVSGFDAEKFDDIIQKALAKPAFGDNKMLFVIIGIVIIILLLFIICGMEYQSYKMLKTLGMTAQAAVGGL